MAKQQFKQITQWCKEVVIVLKEKDLKKERQLIKEDLLNQLKEKGLTQSFYKSLVDDYLSLWDIKNMLIENIKKEGVVITYNNGGGQTGRKKNDAVPELNKVNGQMLKILCDLGLRGADVKIEKADFEL